MIALHAGFFDYYIIPLTQKLKDCGVFGVSSGEFLDFARKNREEWERQGEEVVAGMIEDCERKYGKKGVVLTRGTKVPRLRAQQPLEQSPDQTAYSSASSCDDHSGRSGVCHEQAQEVVFENEVEV